ncbi:MAG: 2Fe-2S iron-sulfur cluster-binding protein [Ignavibacteria bacterium]|nr:2Fe-2S iron-sulfur cluster-binding protein [Ignavibacteria bacterium]
MAKITITKFSQMITVKEGTELKRVCELYPDLPIKFGCRQGTCGTCVFTVLAGAENLSRKTKEEIETLKKLKLDVNQRLACQCAVMGDVVI